MSTVTGSINVGVEFRDGTTETNLQSVNVASMRDAIEYTSGKVAIVSGTVGAAPIVLGVSPSAYRNAAGNFVSLAGVQAVAMRGTAGLTLYEPGASRISLKSNGTNVAVGYASSTNVTTIFLAANTGTAAYTCVMYGT